MAITIATLLRLADDTTRPITIIRADGECEWEAVTIDGIPARHWLDENSLQCGRGAVANGYNRKLRKEKTSFNRHEKNGASTKADLVIDICRQL